jgi:hypothetical protein
VQPGEISGSEVAVRVFVGDGIVVLVGEGVTEGIGDVIPGVSVAITTGVRVVFPHPPNKSTKRIKGSTINTRFNIAISRSISNSRCSYNWLKGQSFYDPL